MASAARIRAGFVAFAAGDAFGAPWEGKPPRDLAGADIDTDTVAAIVGGILLAEALWERRRRP